MEYPFVYNPEAVQFIMHCTTWGRTIWGGGISCKSECNNGIQILTAASSS